MIYIKKLKGVKNREVLVKILLININIKLNILTTIINFILKITKSINLLIS